MAFLRSGAKSCIRHIIAASRIVRQDYITAAILKNGAVLAIMPLAFIRVSCLCHGLPQSFFPTGHRPAFKLAPQ